MARYECHNQDLTNAVHELASVSAESWTKTQEPAELDGLVHFRAPR